LPDLTFTVVFVRSVPWWGIASALIAPFALIGGWTLAAALQPGSFNAVSRSISSLAAYGAADRWVMTLGLFIVGACNIVTGLALRSAPRNGRILLMAGGVFGLLIAVSPESMGGTGIGSLRHAVVAGLGCAVMTAWPLAALRREPWAPAGLRPAATFGVTGLLLTLIAWFCFEVVSGGDMIGLAERAVTGVQTLWPLLVVGTVVAAARRRSAMRAVLAVSRARSGRLGSLAAGQAAWWPVIPAKISAASPGSNPSVASPTESSIRCTPGSVVVMQVGTIQMPRSSASPLAAAA
jgi:hypothetical membrane protein